jgi:hypothetical protein
MWQFWESLVGGLNVSEKHTASILNPEGEGSMHLWNTGMQLLLLVALPWKLKIWHRIRCEEAIQDTQL